MKKIIVLFIVMFAFLASNKTQAQKKETINSTEKEYKTVKHDGVTYYVFDGLWHTKMKNRFVLKAAPKGARTNFIPKGGKMVVMGGKKYYKCKGIFYRKDVKGFYEIARP